MVDFVSILIKNAVVFTIIGTLMGFALAPIPASFFNKDAFLYKTRPFERNGLFYEKHFKITRWKDKLPQFSEIVKIGFSKDSLNSLSQPYLNRFLTETMRAEFCHFLLILISPVYVLINDTPSWDAAMLIVSVTGNIPFIMIQRFNRPRIAHLLVQIAKRKEKGKVI